MSTVTSIVRNTLQQASRARSWEEQAAVAETGLQIVDLHTDDPLLDQSIHQARGLGHRQTQVWLKAPILLQALEDVAIMAAGTNVVAEIARAAGRRGERLGRNDQASAVALQALNDIALQAPDSPAGAILEKARNTADDQEFYLTLRLGLSSFEAG